MTENIDFFIDVSIKTTLSKVGVSSRRFATFQTFSRTSRVKCEFALPESSWAPPGLQVPTDPRLKMNTNPKLTAPGPTAF